MNLLWWRRQPIPKPSPGTETKAEHAELARLERLAEQAYSAMYEVPPLSSAKDDYDDACLHFGRAIEQADRLGLTSEVARLTQRRDHVRAVYASQFRGL
jgi:hypothetical protein